jgi:hypothetical protein
MAALVVQGNELVLNLSTLEKIGAVHGSIRVPLSAVQVVRVAEDPWSELRGMRAPGTGVPGVIALGTRRGTFGADFVSVRGKAPVVIVELEGARFKRLYVTTPDPAGTVHTIEEAKNGS